MAHWGGGRGGMNIYIYFFFVITYFLIQYLDIHGPLARGGGGGTHPLHLSLYRPVRESSAASKIFRKVQFV